MGYLGQVKRVAGCLGHKLTGPAFPDKASVLPIFRSVVHITHRVSVIHTAEQMVKNVSNRHIVDLPTFAPGNLTLVSKESAVIEEVKAAVKMEIITIPTKIHITANRRPPIDLG